MSLIVEDGSVVAGAESYISVADATSYHSKRGNSTWALLTTAQMEEALRRATDYMTQVYRIKWLGSLVSGTQSLDWPRVIASRADGALVASDSVPNDVMNVCAELALKAGAGELAPDLGRRVTKEKVDVIEVEYADYGTEYVRFRAIDNMLAPYLALGSSGVIRKVLR